jgi:hypothetical protein
VRVLRKRRSEALLVVPMSQRPRPPVEHVLTVSRVTTEGSLMPLQ